MTVRKPRAARKPKAVVEPIAATPVVALGWDVVETSVPPSDQALDETLEQMSALLPIRFALAFANVARIGWGF